MNRNQNNSTATAKAAQAATPTFTSIENKIQEAAVRIRQQRDEAHRALQLEEERLRLAKEDYEAVLSTVKTAKENIEKTKAEAGGEKAEREHAGLQHEVGRLQREVRD